LADRPSDGIAILFSSENQIANFSVYAHLDTYNDSIQGTHKLLHDLNYKVEFVHDNDVSRKTLDKYKCLWMPYPLYLNKQMTDVIREWVREGGILISECSFGALQAENGSHSYQVPGYGFDEVFGVRETWNHSVENLDHSYHNVTIKSKTKIPLISLIDGKVAHGSFYKSEVELLRDVKIVANFAEDQSAAVTISTFGKGKAVWIGTLLAAAFWQDGNIGTQEFVKTLLEQGLLLEPYVKNTGGQSRTDVLEWEHDGKKGAFLFVNNWGSVNTEIAVHLPFTFESVTSWFDEGHDAFVINEDNGSLMIRPEAGDIQVFTLHNVTGR
jgi:beta-galactosidase